MYFCHWPSLRKGYPRNERIVLLRAPLSRCIASERVSSFPLTIHALAKDLLSHLLSTESLFLEKSVNELDKRSQKQERMRELLLKANKRLKYILKHIYLPLIELVLRNLP